MDAREATTDSRALTNRDSPGTARWLLKRDLRIDWRVGTRPAPADDDTAFSRIRCPVCSWQPDASSRWCCDWVGTPEPFFESCGTVWNTFETRGRCPGC